LSLRDAKLLQSLADELMEPLRQPTRPDALPASPAGPAAAA